MQSTASSILPTVVKGNVVCVQGWQKRPRRFDIVEIESLILPPIAVRGYEHEMWPCPAELVGGQKVGGANFANLKATSTDIAPLSLLMQLINSVCRWWIQVNCWLFGKSRGKQELELEEYDQNPWGYLSMFKHGVRHTLRSPSMYSIISSLSLYMTAPELTRLSNSVSINDSSMIVFERQKLPGLCLYWSICCEDSMVMA